MDDFIGAVSIWTLMKLHNERFLSMTDLNQAIMDKLKAFNHSPFKSERAGGVASFAEKKFFLLALPTVAFELAVWKVVTVSYDYHISVGRIHYSISYIPCRPW